MKNKLKFGLLVLVTVMGVTAHSFAADPVCVGDGCNTGCIGDASNQPSSVDLVLLGWDQSGTEIYFSVSHPKQYCCKGEWFDGKPPIARFYYQHQVYSVADLGGGIVYDTHDTRQLPDSYPYNNNGNYGNYANGTTSQGYVSGTYYQANLFVGGSGYADRSCSTCGTTYRQGYTVSGCGVNRNPCTSYTRSSIASSGGVNYTYGNCGTTYRTGSTVTQAPNNYSYCYAQPIGGWSGPSGGFRGGGGSTSSGGFRSSGNSYSGGGWSAGGGGVHIGSSRHGR